MANNEKSAATEQVDTAITDQAVAEGGAYEVLRKRLSDQGSQLKVAAEALNAERLAAFGSSELKVIGRLRVRTEHNCVPRDLVQVGECLLFGYNVFLGLKKETQVDDVFALYKLVEGTEGFDVEPQALKGSFLDQASFVADFKELYAYYKNTRLLQLVRKDEWLLASFQIGDRISDVRVFRWSVSADGQTIRYVDNRGERDIALPPNYDFEWTRCGREHAVEGRHPHLNILDTVFVETVGGDLTVKIENNTNDGLGIYREPVDDQTQSLDDAKVDFAKVGSLILLRILPYRETQSRYLAYNTLTREVRRIDAIGQACVQLPEDHGIVFPGGYLLQNGEYRQFEQSMAGMRFKRMIRSPNGEDVLYIFYEPEDGRFALFTYNLIERKLQPPLFGHGYARYDDGRIVLFSMQGSEATRVHPMQIWQTAFCSDEFAAQQPAKQGFAGRIGNAELVRGVSNLLNLCREIEAEKVSQARYERLIADARKLFDLHHWLAESHCEQAAAVVRSIAQCSELVIDEFVKVEAIRASAERALAEARTLQSQLKRECLPERCEAIADFVTALNRLSRQRGHLLSIRELRYMDVAAIDAMGGDLQAWHDELSRSTAAFLDRPEALADLAAQLDAQEKQLGMAENAAKLRELVEALKQSAADLDLLSQLLAGLPVDDAEQRTRIVEAISALYARLNQIRARAEAKRKQLGSAEAVAQFGAQFHLFSQSVSAALADARDPEACDDALARVLVQLEGLEGQFGEHEQFLQDILAKREEVLEAFESHKQTLLDERQRRAQGLHDAAVRIIDGLPRRTEKFSGADELNSFFAGDALILKLRDLVERLRGFKDSVKADDIEARLKACRDQAARRLRDASELFEDGGNLIRLGRHRFSVNRQELDLTLIPRGERLCLHLTGTDFFQPIQADQLDSMRPFWEASLPSESAELSRAEYLAGAFLEAAERGEEGLDAGLLIPGKDQASALEQALRKFAAARYREGYEKGLHDHDAARILAAWAPLRQTAGLLRFAPGARALAMHAWKALREGIGKRWPERARAAARLRAQFDDRAACEQWVKEIATDLLAPAEALDFAKDQARQAAAYLFEVLAEPHPQFAFSRPAHDLRDALQRALANDDGWRNLLQSAAELQDLPRLQRELILHALNALLRRQPKAGEPRYVDEAAALILLADHLPNRFSEADLSVEVQGLLSAHQRIQEGRLPIAVDDLDARLAHHRQHYLPQLQRFQSIRHAELETARERMRLGEFKPRPLTSFVRNRLIDQVYLPLIGDNLAKQMGSVGEGKRSDLMGLLMLISPPGYGKTTLMEYTAHQLGLIFMKINGPSLGHEVRSLDPAQAPDANARQELEKLNLALEMGNNVMLYVDDIQHTHPEFLQKFISLCDATRRIEGVYGGRTKTYDMRGKKFCVVMAGNPYTESGDLFRIPDMLANRADVYNLGDVLGGMQEAFLLSYIENSLTSSPVLAPLATRGIEDLYKLVDKIAGKGFSASALAHSYSAAELSDMEAVLSRLMKLRDVVFKVNQQYIASAAQAEAYRTEPAFKLQGSYRNMNKLAEKVSAVMNEAELDQLVRDHYLGESQLLTHGAEENLLKLGELLGTQKAEDKTRWEQIKADFRRLKAIGGADSDTGTRVVAQLHDLVQGVNSLKASEPVEAAASPPWSHLSDLLERIVNEQTLARNFNRDAATDSAMFLSGLRNALELGFKPLVEAAKTRSEQQDVLIELLKRLTKKP
ncbi:DNA repair ATPase [Pseudomarimonas arenosa]|uniref:DNA repair ATPase n=1 Tax=Pseudomarimonas arenosa TaxID=2774145 RepID=A0AAW3ZL75_9GAMM|nr:DNA repair ATPase [Pseudomarimonas arenosa]MBD8526264.1 DNA repair ATPase [Pseudomarimonas arenosa]